MRKMNQNYNGEPFPHETRKFYNIVLMRTHGKKGTFLHSLLVVMQIGTVHKEDKLIILIKSTNEYTLGNSNSTSKILFCM